MRQRLIHRTEVIAIVTALVLACTLFVPPLQPVFAHPAGELVPVTNADGRLGFCDVLTGSPVSGSGPTWADLAYGAGARTNRWEFRMDKLESSPGLWDFGATDAVVRSDTAHGLDTEGILIGTPGWSVRPGQNPGNGLPTGLLRPLSDSANVWADFVRQTVRHYAGQVAYWEIWNEPDLKFFWTSTPGDYYQLLKVSFEVIKAVDPSAKVVMAGMVVPDLNFASSVLDAARADPTSRATHGHFDTAAWHAYGPARSVYTNVSRLESLLTSRGFADTPVWVTEAGFPASNPNGESRQAAFVIQSIAYAFAAGAERVFVYRASDDSTPKAWGLISATGIPRPAYTEFAVAAQYLSHVQAVSYSPTPVAERFVFYTSRTRVSLYWTSGVTEHSLFVPAARANAQLVDWQGTVAPLAAANGEFHLVARGASYNKGVDPPGQVVGGPPLMVVEDNSRPANLSAPSYIPPIAGRDRQLMVLNDADTTASVEVSVPGVAFQRIDLHVGPHAVRFVDLELLSGPSYDGLFRVSSNSAIAVQALSGSIGIAPASPAAEWSVPNAPPVLMLSNPTAAAVQAQLTAYGYGGKVRARARVSLASLDSVRWSPPVGLRAVPLSLSVEASGRLVVSGSPSTLPQAVGQPRSTWYVVAPRVAKLVLFNQEATPVQVDVRYIGARSVASEQLKLRAHRSYAVSTHRAKAVIVSSTHPISTGYSGIATRTASESDLSTRTALTVGGSVTAVSVYNPSPQAARVTVTVVGRAGEYTTSRLVKRAGVSIVQVRKVGDAPRGVVVSSDLPVVATASA